MCNPLQPFGIFICTTIEGTRPKPNPLPCIIYISVIFFLYSQTPMHHPDSCLSALLSSWNPPISPVGKSSSAVGLMSWGTGPAGEERHDHCYPCSHLGPRFRFTRHSNKKKETGWRHREGQWWIRMLGKRKGVKLTMETNIVRLLHASAFPFLAFLSFFKTSS